MKFAQRGLPIVSIDTKKRELIGNFKNYPEENEMPTSVANFFPQKQIALQTSA